MSAERALRHEMTRTAWTDNSRDRFGLYARAAQRGAPQAQQVADRLHLLVDLQEAVEHELSRQRRLLFYV
jgi:transposase